MTCRSRFISGNACTTLVEGVAMREAVSTWGQRLCGKSLDIFLSFAVNLKLLSKNKIYLRGKQKGLGPRVWSGGAGGVLLPH